MTHLLFPLLLIACDSRRAVVRGDLDRGDCSGSSIDEVRVRGGSDTATVRDCRFRLALSDSGDIVLTFVGDGEERGRMYLAGVPARSEVTLQGVWLDGRGLAHPVNLRAASGARLQINGVRMADPDELPARLALAGMVLAIDRDESLLLVRPSREELPDLRVHLDPTAEIVTTRGDAGSLATLEFGDSVTLEGRSAQGMVVARRLVVPDRASRPEEPVRTGDLWTDVQKILEVFGVTLER